MNKYLSILSLSAAMAVVSGCATSRSGETQRHVAALAVPSVALADPEYLSSSVGQLRGSVRAEKSGSGIYYLPDLDRHSVMIVIVDTSGGNLRSVFMEREFSWFPASTQEKITAACEKAGKEVPLLRTTSFNLNDCKKIDGKFVITDPVSGYVCLISEFGSINTPASTMKLTYGLASLQPHEIQEVHNAQLAALAAQPAVVAPVPALK